jgi:hypothetical protein
LEKKATSKASSFSYNEKDSKSELNTTIPYTPSQQIAPSIELNKAQSHPLSCLAFTICEIVTMV